MVSRKFNVYRYTYQADDGSQFIREQRVQVNPSNSEEIVPITGVFLNSVVSLPQAQKKIKAEKFNDKERKLIVVYRTLSGTIGETNRYVPYNDGFNISNQYREQKQFNVVLCADYEGESRDYQLSKQFT